MPGFRSVLALGAGSRFSLVDGYGMLMAGFCRAPSSNSASVERRITEAMRRNHNNEIWCRSMLILIILLVLLFGGGFFGFSRYGSRGGLGIGGIILLILILWLLLGGGLANIRL